MQITGLPIVTQPAPQTQRPDIAERVQKSVQRETDRSADDDSRSNSTLEEQRARREDILQQRVEASNQGSNINAKRLVEDDNLPLNTRRALQAFAENTPTPEQRLGIDLVGVDTFA